MKSNLTIRDVATPSSNSRNGQHYLNFKKKQLKKFGITHKQILNMKIPEELINNG